MATVMGPSEMPHGMVVIVMSRWEAETLASLVTDVSMATLGEDDDLASIAAAFASLREGQ
jgi:hypothetical protein